MMRGAAAACYEHRCKRRLLRTWPSTVVATRRRPDRDYLDPLLIEADGRLAPAEKQFPGYWGQSRPTKPVPALYWSSYGLKTADVRASIATQVTAMTARFARWKRIEAAYVTLTNALARLKDPRLPVHRDGESVLDLVQGEPLDDVETRTRESAMATFAVIVGLYADVARRWKAAVERHGRDWETKHRSLDPAKIYQAAPCLATRTPEHAAALRLDFLRARRLLADPESVPDDKPARSPRRNLLEGVLAFDELNIDAAFSKRTESHEPASLAHYCLRSCGSSPRIRFAAASAIGTGRSS